MKLKGVFARVNEEFHSTVDSLKNELGQDFSNNQGRIRIISVADSIGYSYNGDGIGYDYRNLIYHDTQNSLLLAVRKCGGFKNKL